MNENNSKEIDLRALIQNNLKLEKHDIGPVALCDDKEINLLPRKFDTGRVWNKIEQTSYIESIFLQCSLQPIVRFKYFNHTVIIDGYNRYMAIANYCNNNLVLNPKGLKQLKFLANRSYNSLSDAEKSYFAKCEHIRVIDYSYYNKNLDTPVLSLEEEFEIERYLHLVYSSGLRLELEEMQKAQFADDFLTNKIKEKIENEPSFLEILEKMRLFNGRKKKNKIDNILLNCRLLIASTYSNMEQFCSACNTEERTDKNYLPNLVNVDVEQAFEDFTFNINLIYKHLINTQKWLSYPILHSKPFLDATYWLISVINKDNLSDLVKFDFIAYLEYFGEIEEKMVNFNSFQSHYRENFHHKYWIVADYYERKYGVDMSGYFKEQETPEYNKFVINSLEELNRYHFNYHPVEIKIENLMKQLSVGSYNLRPYYQRTEVMNTELSSKIIESLLLGIEIPYLLVYDKLENGNYITEVVDGQQRILAILGFLQKQFKNEQGKLERSKKDGYALKNLRIFTEFNNMKAKSDNPKEVLDEKYLEKIMNTTLYLSKAKEGENNNFSAVDHFVRLNKNICPIRENSYRMWGLTADREIVECEMKLTDDFVGKVLPKHNSKKSPNIITMKLARLFYYNDITDIKLSNYTNNKVSLWLNEFTNFKDKNLYKNEDEIETLRIKYLNAFNDTRDFYIKLECLLHLLDKTIIDLLAIDKSWNIPLSNYYYLFCMLGDISKADLLNNAEDIYNIINKFFNEIKRDKLENKVIVKKLCFTVKQIAIFHSYRRNEFKSRLDSIIRNS